MSTAPRPIRDLSELQPGDSVDVYSDKNRHYSGLVEETMPEFNVVWIRNSRTGERKIVLTDEDNLLLA